VIWRAVARRTSDRRSVKPRQSGSRGRARYARQEDRRNGEPHRRRDNDGRHCAAVTCGHLLSNLIPSAVTRWLGPLIIIAIGVATACTWAQTPRPPGCARAPWRPSRHPRHADRVVSWREAIALGVALSMNNLGRVSGPESPACPPWRPPCRQACSRSRVWAAGLTLDGALADSCLHVTRRWSLGCFCWLSARRCSPASAEVHRPPPIAFGEPPT